MQPMAYNEQVPPFNFSQREHGIDPEATAREGYEVPRLVTFIEILPHGQRDPISFEAIPWLANKSREAADGRYNPQWVATFKNGYDEYLKGNEIPATGSPLILWERILKTRREALKGQFPTVEDLAACPDSNLGLIGLDGRYLRDIARADVQARKSMEPIVLELAATNEENRQLKERMDTLVRRLEALEAAGQTKRGREAA